MRSISLVLLTTTLLCFSSVPSTCSAAFAAPPLASTLRSTYHTLATNPTTVFIPTYGTITLPSFVDPNLIPGYNAASGAVESTTVDQAVEYLKLVGINVPESENTASGASGTNAPGAGATGGSGPNNNNDTDALVNEMESSSSGRGFPLNLNQNTATSISPFSLGLCGALVSTVLVTVAAAAL